MTPETPEYLPQTVASRPTGAAHVVTICLILLAVFFAVLSLKSSDVQDACRVFSAFCGIGAAAWSIVFRRFRIRADANGLTWRTPEFSGSCTWRDITDYHLLPVQGRESAYVIETTDKKVMFSKENWTHAEVLAQTVQQRTAGQLGYEWAERGSRAQEPFPMTFRYNTAEAKVWRGMGWTCGAALVLLYPLAVAESWRNAAPGTGHSEPILRAVILLLCLLPTLYIAAQFVRIGNDTKRRLDETLTVDAEGITLATPTEHTFIRWREVTAYRKERALLLLFPYVLESAHATIRYTNHLRHSSSLRTVIERFVPPELCRVTDTPKAPQTSKSS